MTEAATLRAWFGTEEPPSRTRLLRAGGLTAELDGGNLRAIRFDGIEVLRAISYVVRDKDWGTYAPHLDGLTVEEEPDGFRVGYTARCAGLQGQTLAYAVTIEASAAGRLHFAATATPDAAFETNRCGFCVLHPVRDLAGTPVEVEHGNGTTERAVFPALIAPWQPFKTIRALTHAVRPGLMARCLLEGDDFEMEDQRNWTDASYKTYVRPLERPWPYVLPARIAQSQAVTLTLEGDLRPHAAPREEAVVTLEIGPELGPMPGFALLVTPEEAEAVAPQAARLRELAPQTLVFGFDPTSGHGADALRAFAAVQALHRSETLLEFVVPCVAPLDQELGAAASMARCARLRIDALVVSPAVDLRSTPPGSAWPHCPPLAELYAAARRQFPQTRLGGGMISTFTELNRKRPPFELLDFVTHCTNPIVHAADDRSVMETLEALPFVTRSVRAMIGADKSYRIGPTTIGMRQNPYGSRVIPNPGNGRVAMAGRDPRQSGAFAAAWMMGYSAATAGARLDSFCGGALTGDLGLLHPDGGARPVFHVAKALAGWAGRARIGCQSSHPDRVLGLAVTTDRGGVLLCAVNITDQEQTICVRHGFTDPRDDRQTLELQPFALSEINTG